MTGIVTAADNSFGSAVLLTAAAGEDWDKFVGYCVDRDLAGIECLSGIPGFVGGTPVQNVGAYGQEVSETIVAVRCCDRSTGRIIELQNGDCGFAYRSSIFNSTHRNSYIVLAVTFRLVKGGGPKIVYKDLAEHLAGEAPSLCGTRAAVLAIRRAKSMVIDPGDPNSKSAGSFFKNPIVAVDILESIASAYGPVPHFPASDGSVKIPAAWLIERAGFHKGYVLGNAGISTNHSLAIINRGGASAAEIMTLKDRIAGAVRARFGIELKPEPVFVGY
jgi:UDP-N-acetylmuramate dehydrogenase